ncbi:MAG: hypothetical protein IAA89_03540 [Firmicutes bacterium]|uniref:Uncharacterized protein n=1 Tax=Candidatus Gallilactobacillus intestinavium TaxID=2840838 RepID=A0A9D9EA51_9LACO|nr:hypothetical protein [Candidatus Gallilactobacillus intestinavium]
MLNHTKIFLKDHGFKYEKKYIRPMLVAQHVYVMHFGKDGKLNNRLVVKYSHGIFSGLKIYEYDLRLHKQHNPRIFYTEKELLKYLETHLLNR